MFELDDDSFPSREEKILKFWKEAEVFEKSMDNREKGPLFSTYDGPPFATGLPHYGHILAGTIKDVIPRYKTMKGMKVPRRFGWDCHGLPVENEIEKAKGLNGASTIEEFGIAAFNEECRSIVLRYTEEWKFTVERMGRWVSFKDTYKTMDKSFMESVWWVFSSLWQKGLIYQGFKVMPFSAKLGTPLSNFEANLNYKDVDDPSLTVRFKVKGEENTFLLVWTTTPWTLPSNLACVVNPHLTYVKLIDKETKDTYILAKSRVSHSFKEEEKYEILSSFKGEELKGISYEPLFRYFATKASQNAFTVLLDEFVGEEDGTGIVHAAPAFGEQDFYVCVREGIELVCPVDQNGKFTKEVKEYEGLFVKDADKEIIKRLKGEGKVFHHGQVRHRYPFCWRSDTPLLYRAMKTWFMSVEKIKDKLLAANEKIRWVPEHIKHGRFGNWLENARDWAISRNRYWGTPIPLWQSEEGDFIALSSAAELEQLSGQKIEDLHRHFIDDITFVKEGKIYKRVPEVFDCWFESGSMPYAENHFPFENKEKTLEAFPADFIAEGLDQTRGWFYTLTVIAAALFDQPAFKNVIVNGIVLAEDGNKMSKRLKNYPDPLEVVNKYGADSIRLYLMHSPVVLADDMRFSERGVELVLRGVLIPMWNAYVFFATYAKISLWKPKLGKNPKQATATIDRWILSQLQKLILDVEKAMEDYQLSLAVTPLVTFVDQLTNWFIRRSRSRFWASEPSKDQEEAFETLYETLLSLAKVAAPFIPFLAESIYLQLKQEKDPLSVHLTDYPVYDATLRDEALEQEMNLVQKVVSLGHSLRKEHKLKVRQPLKKALIILSDAEQREGLKHHLYLMKEELNVHEIEFISDESQFVELSIKPNFKVLGKKLGPKMKEAKAVIESLSRNKVETLYRGGNIEVEIGGELFTLSQEEVEVSRSVKGDLVALCEGPVTIVLETTLDEGLIKEGIAREIVNKINTMRRSQGFNVVDRIVVVMNTTERVRQAFKEHEAYICNEVLASQVDFKPCQGTEWDLSGELAVIQLTKI